jgi:hypothetical protein
MVVKHRNTQVINFKTPSKSSASIPFVTAYWWIINLHFLLLKSDYLTAIANNQKRLSRYPRCTITSDLETIVFDV